ncbi:hypothetical protein JCM11491_005819 [Sporobolomyces phaffii]
MPPPSSSSTSSTQDGRIAYLRSLGSIRERCRRVFALAEQDALDYWTVDLARERAIVDFVCELIARDYGTDYGAIPPHGRWRHFVGDRVDPVLTAWNATAVDELEQARRLVDLMVVSVLMDAGAGNEWKYHPTDGGDPIARSEGLAVGSLDMFTRGMFSGVASQPERVDAVGLSKVTASQVADAMQVSESNPMTGIDGRAQLLIRLGDVLAAPANAAYFSSRNSGDEQQQRPGHLVDYLLAHPTSQAVPAPVLGRKVAVEIDTLWDVVVTGLSGVWPAARTKIDGVSLGDVWPVDCLRRQIGDDDDEAGQEFVSFHKLSQWLTYSLIEVMEKLLGWTFIGKEKCTGLPEYRNGGLLIDFDLLRPKFAALLESFDLAVPSADAADFPRSLLELPALDPAHSAVVEMRAVTVVALDRIADQIRTKLGVDLTLAQVLEAGTWKAGREIAKKLRPETGGPPFAYVADGTVF